MKYLLTMFILVLLVCAVSLCLAGYDSTPRPKATPDLLEFIIKTPAVVYEKHGYSERTDILYNLARFKELYMESAKQIQDFQARIKLLEDMPVSKIDDVNSIE